MKPLHEYPTPISDGQSEHIDNFYNEWVCSDSFPNESIRLVPLETAKEIEQRLAQALEERDEARATVRALETRLTQLREDGEMLKHLFEEAYFPGTMVPFVVPKGEVVLCIADDVELDEEGYRSAIRAAMKE